MGSDKKITIACDRIAEWSLYIMIFVLPFSKSLIEITIVTALISVIIRKALAREKLFDNNAVNLFLAIFILASLISLVNSQYMALSIRAFFTKILKFAALFLVTMEIINTRKKLIRFVIVALASVVLIVIDAFIQRFITGVDILHAYPLFGKVPTASFPFPNDFAAWILLFIFPIGTYLIFGNARASGKYLPAAAFAALFYFLFLSKVRGAWFSFVGALALFALLKPKMIGITLLIFIILLAGLIHNQFIYHIMTLTRVNERVTMWDAGQAIFKQHPIIGNGVNTFFNEYKMARQGEDRGIRGSYAHNCYLQMACDIGLFGLFSFFAFVGAVLLKGLRFLRRIKDPFLYSLVLGLGLGLTAFLFHSAVDTNLYSLPLAALFWLSCGIFLTAVKIAGSEL